MVFTLFNTNWLLKASLSLTVNNLERYIFHLRLFNCCFSHSRVDKHSERETVANKTKQFKTATMGTYDSYRDELTSYRAKSCGNDE